MKYIKLELNEEKKIAFLEFSRQDSFNAMNKQMMDEIIDAIFIINNTKVIDVAVCSGAGGNFMAGADIKEYSEQSSEEFLAFQRKGRILYQSIEESAIPYIAMVDGYALGGGFEIALACDMIFSSQEAQFGLPEVNLALVPGGGGTQRLAERIGLNRVKEMLFTGDRYSAQVCYEWGIINKIYDAKNLRNETIKFCEKLTRRSKKAIAELKFLAVASFRQGDLSNRIRYEGDICHTLFMEAESRKKISRFIEKSKEA